METDTSRDLLDASMDASDRARRVLLVMIVASVLSFVAFWNSRQNSWLAARIDCAEAAIRYREAQEAPGGTSQTTQDSNGKDCAQNYDLTTAVEARAFKETLQGVLVEHVMYIRIPFFGVVVDVNDLGIFAGFAFSIILLWFRFSLWQELNGLKALRSALHGSASEVRHYDVAAARQVLTVPPSSMAKQDTERKGTERVVWKVAVYALMGLPAAVSCVIAWHDLETFARGRVVSDNNVLVGLFFSAVFAAVVVVVSGFAMRLNWRIDAEWREWSDHVAKSRRAELVD